jgi:glycosyltransferase involved in cell wall biosynthesis
MPRFSILIPARNEERELPRCLESIRAASAPFPGQVEVVVALNRCTDRTEAIARASGATVVREDARNLARIRNAAARAASGEVIVTIDADSRMSPNMLTEIDRLLRGGRCVGGGARIRAERMSAGIAATGLVLGLIVVLRHGVSAGLFWCLRTDFEAIGGFNEDLVSIEDVDFARRLKARGRATGRRFATIRRAHIVTSCRKFDLFGDWFLFRNPAMVFRLFRRHSQEDADRFWYDVKR